MEKADFLEIAISDIQGTIRASDVKSGIVLGLQLAQIAYIKDIVSYFIRFYGFNIHFIAIITISALWIASIYTSIASIFSIQSPSRFINTNERKNLDSFYGAGLYSMNIFDVFWNFRNLSKRTLEQEIEILPSSNDDLIAILTYEKMKISYIRDIKIKRLSYSIVITVIWALLSFVLYLSHAVEV